MQANQVSQQNLGVDVDQMRMEYARQNSHLKAKRNAGASEKGENAKIALNEVKINLTQKFEAQERRRKIEMILLNNEPGERTDEQVKQMREVLVMEFRIFKELASQSAGIVDEVSIIARDHLALERTFERKNLTEEVSD